MPWGIDDYFTFTTSSGFPALIVELDASALEAKGDEKVAAVGGLDPVESATFAGSLRPK